MDLNGHKLDRKLTKHGEPPVVVNYLNRPAGKNKMAKNLHMS